MAESQAQSASTHKTPNGSQQTSMKLPPKSERILQCDWYSKLRLYFDEYAPVREQWRSFNSFYHAELERHYRYHIPAGAKVLEIGCGTGELLAALKPSSGLGIDLSPATIQLARRKFPELQFEAGIFESMSLPAQPFDYIVLSDVLGYVHDLQEFFGRLRQFCHARTRVIINVHSRLWQPVLSLAVKLHLKYPQPVLNWLTVEDISGLLYLAGFEVIHTHSKIVLPKQLPLISRLLNRLAPLRPLKWFALTNWIVARLPQPPLEAKDRLTVSIICPCRNEAGNIPQVVTRLPRMGSRTELIFIEGNSTDETYNACLQAQRENPDLPIQVLKQQGRGKKDAVWLGCEHATGEVLMILDADLTVPPEDLPEFLEVLATGRAEFVNGSRMVYAMDRDAMRFLNLLGNKFFSNAFSYLIGQPVKDTLCGTKVLLRSDYEKLKAGRAYFGNFDPFGDFDLLFGVAKMGLKIVDLPVRYRARGYGSTQISRFRDGWTLLKMCGVALWRLKLR